jgi:hypothetical protein
MTASSTLTAAPMWPLTLLALVSSASAYTWNFTSTPKQCETLSLQVSGEGGKPPYHALLQTFGPSPLPNNIEARKIMNLPFNDSTSLSFQLRYPQNSQFVVVVRPFYLGVLPFSLNSLSRSATKAASVQAVPQ